MATQHNQANAATGEADGRVIAPSLGAIACQAHIARITESHAELFSLADAVLAAPQAPTATAATQKI